MPVKRLKEYLDENNVRYVTINHSPAYTAREIAASAMVPRIEFAKTLVVKVDGKNCMAVLPASRRADLEQLADVLDAETVELTDEAEFNTLFPGCEVGAMPPFGNLYDMDVYVAQSLTADDDIVFNAGSHTQVIQMSYADYERLAQPTVIDFSVKA